MTQVSTADAENQLEVANNINSLKLILPESPLVSSKLFNLNSKGLKITNASDSLVLDNVRQTVSYKGKDKELEGYIAEFKPNADDGTLTEIFPNQNKATLIKFTNGTIDEFTHCSIQMYEMIRRPRITGLDQKKSFCLTVTTPMCKKILAGPVNAENFMTFIDNAKKCEMKSKEQQACKSVENNIVVLNEILAQNISPTNNSDFKKLALENTYLLANKFLKQSKLKQGGLTYELEVPSPQNKVIPVDSGIIPFDSEIKANIKDTSQLHKYNAINYAEMCAKLFQIKPTEPSRSSTEQTKTAPPITQ